MVYLLLGFLGQFGNLKGEFEDLGYVAKVAKQFLMSHIQLFDFCHAACGDMLKTGNDKMRYFNALFVLSFLALSL